MENGSICYTPIGVVRSPFTTREDMPIQPSGARGVSGSIELKEEFVEGLKDLEVFSHLYLLYHFHQSQGFSLTVTPKEDVRSGWVDDSAMKPEDIRADDRFK